MFGQILIHLLFAASIAAFLYFLLAIRNAQNNTALTTARWIYRGVAAGTLLAFCMVMVNVFMHRFEYTYVQSYSNSDLEAWYLMAASYAGQEGSFLLWTTWVALIGVFLQQYSRRLRWEAEVMLFYSLILVFLFLLLVVKNPFAFVWETYAKDAIPQGFAPENGRGLNPLLHNVWITIHPPILFTGFAALSVPFAFAMAALIKKEYQRWVDIVLPWTLYATAILGFGIMLGGFWAYETLGWGGFWAWDPVENSSLIPWLAAVALVHTLLIQQKTKGLIKTNIVLSLLSFILVLYSTFLTRSGVLGDTSVHSFVDPGMFAYVILLIFMGTFLIIGVGALIYRAKDMNISVAEFSPKSREFMLSIGSALVLASAATVFIGTSFPLFAELLNLPKVAVEANFYNKIHLPLATIVMIVNGITLVLRWRAATMNLVAKKLTLSLLLSAGATAAMILLGVRDWQFLLLACASWFALFVNAELAIKILRSKFSSTGAYISHAGIALLMLGIVSTSRYSVSEHARLVQGKPTEVLGYTLTYIGKQQIEQDRKDREKFQYLVKIEKSGQETIVKPIMFWSDFNRRQAAFQEPGISWSLTQDIYIAPKVSEIEGELPSRSLSKGESMSLPFDSTVKIEFLRFDMSAMAGGAKNGFIRPGAVLSVQHNGEKKEITLYANINSQTMETTPEPFSIPGTKFILYFSKLEAQKGNLSESKAQISFYDENQPDMKPKEVFTAEASLKPYINLVWFGVIAMVAGFFIAIFRRIPNLKKFHGKQISDLNANNLHAAENIPELELNNNE